MVNQQNKTQIKDYKAQIKDYIAELVENKKPATIKELIQLTQQKYQLSQEELTNLILQLETENRISLTKTSKTQPTTKKSYITSKNTIWFWLTIALAILTVIAVFTIPDNTYPLTYLRQIVGTIFVMLLPGYAFTKVLYPQKMLNSTSTKNLDTLERITLSICLSIALVAIDGLILNYTLWGIRLTPLILSLFSLTIILASIGVLREYTQKTKREIPL